MALSGFSFRIGESVAYDVAVDGADAVFRQRRRINGFARRTFDLRWPIVDTTEKDAILAEFDAAKGAASTATLTHPTYGAQTVMLGEELRIERRAAGRWAVSLTAEIER